MRPFLIIGNPESNRVRGFQRELVRWGHPPASVISWLDVIERPGALHDVPDGEHIVRIDSAGRDFATECALLRLGYPDADGRGGLVLSPKEVAGLSFQRGRLWAPRQAHCGFLRALARLEDAFSQRPGWWVQSPPPSIADLFDKRITWCRLRALGIPAANGLDAPAEPDALRASMRDAGVEAVYVKLASGSSASGLAIYSCRPGLEVLMTTVELADQGMFNTRRVRRETERTRIDRVLSFLLTEGAHVEARVPKARLDGAFFDCRILVIAGEPAFAVVRQSRHPITNIHLGGWRGSTAALQARIDPDVWVAAQQDCCRVAADFGCFHLGIDLVVEPGFASYRVLEANAFGDLFHGLTRDGLSPYGWQIRAAQNATGRGGRSGTRSRMPLPKI